jgi:arylsulfatase A-like enzyme
MTALRLEQLTALLPFLIAMTVCPSVSQAAPPRGEPGSRPNILFLFSDDHQPNGLRALGHPDLITPHLDRFLGRGAVFTRTCIQGSLQPAVCVPSRASLLTGKGLWQVPSDFGPEHPSWLEQFRAAGYATFVTGKWHNGRPAFTRAASHGGGIFFGGMYDHRKMSLWDFAPDTNYPPQAASLRDGFSTELFTTEAIRFLESRPTDRPFVAYVSYMAPHDPRVPPQEFRSLYDPARLTLPPNFLPRHPFNNGELTIRDELLAPWPRTEAVLREHLADYYGMISHLDAEIGRLLARLAELDLARNTIVVFAGDNGLALGQHGLLGKQNLYEHSLRVPLAISGPGIPAGVRYAQLNYLFDLGPTLCELAAVPSPQGATGRSLVPLWKNSATVHRTELYAGYRASQRALVTDRWKLIRYPRIDRTQLFDLTADPYEMTDLSSRKEFAETIVQLRGRFEGSRVSWGDPLGWSSIERDADPVPLPPAN